MADAAVVVPIWCAGLVCPNDRPDHGIAPVDVELVKEALPALSH